MDTISQFRHCTISPSQGDISNITIDHCTISPSQGDIANVTSFHSTISPSQGYIASVTSERQIYSINGFNELTTQSTINNSEEDDVENDPNSDPKVATYTSNGNYPHKLFINWLIPTTIPGAIRPIEQTIQILRLDRKI